MPRIGARSKAITMMMHMARLGKKDGTRTYASAYAVRHVGVSLKLSYKQDTKGVGGVRFGCKEKKTSGVFGRLEQRRLLTLWSPAIAR